MNDHHRACVARVPLLAGLGEEALDRVAAVATSRHHARGATVQAPGDEPALLVLHRGRAKVVALSETGAERVLRVLGPGDFVGETAVLAAEAVEDFTVALADCEVCRVDSSALQRLMAAEPALSVSLVGALARRLRDAEARLGGNASSVARRLADRLLQLADEQGSDDVHLPSTKKDLAAFLGTTPETLSRRLGRFQDDGLVRALPDGSLRLLDRRALEELPADA